MKQLLKMELKRAYTGGWMKIAVIMCFLLAAEHFVLRVLPLDILSDYNPYVASSTPKNLLSGWMAGTPSLENEIYQYVVYIMIILPFGTSYYSDVKSGLIKNIYTRQNKLKYLISKSIAVFASAGTIAVMPLVMNILLCSTILPAIFPEWSSGPNCDGLFVYMYYENYIIYYLAIFLMIFVYAGLIAGLALSISLFARNIFFVTTSPFLICMVSDRLLAFFNSRLLWGCQVSRIFDVVQIGAKYEEGMILLAIVLLVSGYITFIAKGTCDETF